MAVAAKELSSLMITMRMSRVEQAFVTDTTMPFLAQYYYNQANILDLGFFGLDTNSESSVLLVRLHHFVLQSKKSQNAICFFSARVEREICWLATRRYKRSCWASAPVQKDMIYIDLTDSGALIWIVQFYNRVIRSTVLPGVGCRQSFLN